MSQTFKPSTPEDVQEALDRPFLSKDASIGGIIWTGVAIVGFGSALALSYKRNESLLWAAGSGIVWPAYLIYRGIDYASGD